MKKFVVEFSKFVFFACFPYFSEGQTQVKIFQVKIFLPSLLASALDFGRINF